MILASPGEWIWEYPQHIADLQDFEESH